MRLLGAPVKLSRTPADTNRLPGPGLGEHTDAVLRGAGYDEDDIAALHADGTQIMGEAVAARSREGYLLALGAVEIIEAELNGRGLFAQEDENFEVTGWAAR